MWVSTCAIHESNFCSAFRYTALDALVCRFPEILRVVSHKQHCSHSEMIRIEPAAFGFPYPETSVSTPRLSNPEFEAVIKLLIKTDTSLVTMFLPGPGQEFRG
jgi:hypothetical protein